MNFNRKLVKINKILQPWRGKYLSTYGKLALCQQSPKREVGVESGARESNLLSKEQDYNKEQDSCPKNRKQDYNSSLKTSGHRPEKKTLFNKTPENSTQTN